MKSLKLMLTCHLNPIKSRFFGPIQSSLEIQVTAPSTSPATVSRPMIPSRQQRGVAPDQEAWSLLELFPPSVTKLYTYNFPNIAGYNWLHVIIYIYTYIHTYIYILIGGGSQSPAPAFLRSERYATSSRMIEIQTKSLGGNGTPPELPWPICGPWTI
jgi:hypothetical protein